MNEKLLFHALQAVTDIIAFIENWCYLASGLHIPCLGVQGAFDSAE